ncbi:type VI secretion system accessory protein TagJ [Photobacterium alginatilyticum]|uniref:Protein of avirulence locus ImpE n=1 Tax=Photobacterium alginatilyticum TaxID=1775171 RepID=A0ABW9YQK1_9GAMM|nr:type VI secretion system accessory protein TagJ [Photobacterium alginatilyticum]NBI55965.1 protein of avirulence locus ImpE [Photobacterium alginatilyticum]
MSNISSLLQQAKVVEAIRLIENQLQEKPKDVDLRSQFIELLCIDGQLERADKQLNLLVQQNPAYLVGATNVRQLIRAAQARLDFANGAASASIVRKADDSLSALVMLRLALNENDDIQVIESARQLEVNRNDVVMVINEIERERLRDLDDTLADYLEVFGTNGQYYLVPFDALISLELQPVTSLIEQVWRKVEIDIEGGLSGEAFVPMTYIGSNTGAQKLGRETDWLAVNDTGVCVGVGQKMFLFGDDALSFSQINQLKTKHIAMV